MTSTQRGLPTARALTRGFWIATLLVLPLLLPVQASAARLGFFALTLLLVLLLGSLPFIGFLILVTIMLLGTGACALELYNQVRSGRKPPAAGASGSGASSSTTVGSAS